MLHAGLVIEPTLLDDSELVESGSGRSAPDASQVAPVSIPHTAPFPIEETPLRFHPISITDAHQTHSHMLDGKRLMACLPVCPADLSIRDIKKTLKRSSVEV